MLVPIVPHVRSSDIGYLTNPFLYYLRRRLGIARAFDTTASNALATGTWFHRAFEVWHLPEPQRLSALWQSIAAREAELFSIGSLYGMTTDMLAAFVAVERRRALEAYYRLTCALDSPHGPHAPLRAYLNKNYEQAAPPELIVTVPPDDECPVARTIQIDSLLRSKDTGDLWIFDLKSTTLPLPARASRCPFEFQTQHYIHTLSQAIRDGHVPGIGRDDCVAGMAHICLSNFDLKFGQSDRPYHWTAESTRKGRVIRCGTVREIPGPLPHSPSKHVFEFQNNLDGNLEVSTLLFDTETEAVAALRTTVGVNPKKEYAGEPSTDLYLKRIRDRYNGTGQYAHEAEALRLEPPSLVSFTYGQEIDKGYRTHYYPLLTQIADLASRDPDPCNFPKTSCGLEDEDCPFVAFFGHHKSLWPEIMDKERLLVRHRDQPWSPDRGEEDPQEEGSEPAEGQQASQP
jgi:hypothetical protein